MPKLSQKINHQRIYLISIAGLVLGILLINFIALNDKKNNFNLVFRRSVETVNKTTNFSNSLPSVTDLNLINTKSFDKLIYSDNVIAEFSDGGYLMEVYSMENFPDLVSRYPALASQNWSKQKLFYYDKTKDYLFYLNTDSLNLGPLKKFCEKEILGQKYWGFESEGKFYSAKPYLFEVNSKASNICG